MRPFDHLVYRILDIIYNHGVPRSLLAGFTLLVVLTASITLVYVLTPKSSDIGEFRPLDMQIDGGEANTVPVEELVYPMETLVATALPQVARSLDNGETISNSESEFSSAYVHGMVNLTGNRTMIRLVVPDGISGNFMAVIIGWSELHYECFIPEAYNNRLYCHGPGLPNGTTTTIKVFRMNNGIPEETIIFEETFLVSIIDPPPITYGAGFMWSDRFNQDEENRNSTNLKLLVPLSFTISITLGTLWAITWLLRRRRSTFLNTKTEPFRMPIPETHPLATRAQSIQSIRLPNKIIIAAIFVFGISGIVYWSTISPTINSFDSAELITGARVLGIIHSPGYPLYLLLAHLATLIPIGTIPLRVNGISSLCASLAAVCIFYASWRVSGSLWSSLLATFVIAFSRLFWSHAVVAEVYSLNALMVAGVLIAAISWHENPTHLKLLALSFLFGLSLTNHPSAMLLGPGVLILIITDIRKSSLQWRALVPAAFAFLLPLSLYLYLPLRFNMNPPLNYIGDYFDINLASPQGLLWMVSGQMFALEVFGRSFAEGLSNLLLLNIDLWLNLFGGGLFLTLVGLYYLRSKKTLFFFFTMSIAALLIFFAFYDVVDSSKMVIPVTVLLTPLLAIGISRISVFLSNPSHRVSSPIHFVARSIVLIGIVSVMIASNWNYTNRSDDYTAYSFAQDVMSNVEDNALILAHWTSATPLEYLQIVERQREDVEIVDRGLLALGIRDRIRKQGPTSTLGYEDHLRIMIDDALESRPVYVIEEDPLIMKYYYITETGPSIYRVQPYNPLTHNEDSNSTMRSSDEL